MKSKNLKFSIMIIFVLLLIGAYLGIGMFVAPVVQADNSIVDNPFDNVLDGEGNNTDIDISPDDDDVGGSSPVYLPANSINAVNYVLDELYSKPGYKTGISIYFNANGSLGGIGNLSLTQLIKGTGQKCGDEALEELYFYYNSGVSDFFLDRNWILNEYRSIYTNEKTDEAWRALTRNSNAKDNYYNLDDKSELSVSSVEEIFGTYYILFSYPLPINFSSKLCTVTEDNSRDSNYRYITLSFSANNVPENYRSYYHGLVKDLPVVDNVYYKTFTFTFTINKRTGNLIKVVNNQYMSGSVNIVGLPAEINVNVEYVFNIVACDEPFEIPQPHLQSVKYEEVFKEWQETLLAENIKQQETE